MKQARVGISRELVEDALTTGGDPRKLFTNAGVPPGSRLVGARLMDQGRELELLFEHESFEDLDQPPTVRVQIATKDPPAEQQPNRFHYHAAFAWSLAGSSGHMSEGITSSGPIIAEAQIKQLERDFASKIRASGPNGAALVGAQASCVLLSLILLRMWHEEAQPADGNKTPEQPPGMRLVN